MPRPENGIYIIQGEVNLVVSAMRRSVRWTSHHQQNRLEQEEDPLINEFCILKDTLSNVSDFDDLAPNEYLGPFLNVIRSEDTTGPITGLALTSVNKFLSYQLLDENHESTNVAVENMADAVTHARFVGTDAGSDEVVLMKILMVLRTLLLSSVGKLLTNESVCEIMQSCFRICFEMRLSELLRKSAEHTLIDMVQLLFTRLPEFKEDAKWKSLKKLKMRAGGMGSGNAGNRKITKKQSRSREKPISIKTYPQNINNDDVKKENASDIGGNPPETMSAQTKSFSDEKTEETAIASITDDAKDKTDESKQDENESIGKTQMPDFSSYDENFSQGDLSEAGITNIEQSEVDMIPAVVAMPGMSDDIDVVSCISGHATEEEETDDRGEAEENPKSEKSEYINTQGVRFTQNDDERKGRNEPSLIPHGLPCLKELFRFLISLTSPIDRHNTDVMVHMGLNLLTVALESGADYMPRNSSLMNLIKDDMLRNALLLLSSERTRLFAMSLRVCFLLFESMRGHLKFQLEMYVEKLMSIITSESPKISDEQRELALEALVQLCRVPGLVTELYLNYDCHLYCSNLFEDLMKVLSKNAFPVAGLFTTHLLSLDCLLAVIDNIEQHCHHRSLHASSPSNEDKDSNLSESQEHVENSGKTKATIKPNRMICRLTSNTLPSEDDLNAIKHKKKIYITGSESFNNRPSKGVAYLQDQGFFKTPLDPEEVVRFLKENPRLDKKMIGEYISNKKNNSILEAFQKSFNFSNVRIDEALREYLEAFRLPGEAPVIQYLLEHFAQHWHTANNEPFADTDAAFTLSYAVIMLNTDQHNHNVRKQNIPMTVEQFKRNVAGVNGKGDFESSMLEEIYENIRNEEIIMPSEQTGIVRENYLWNVMLRRGCTGDGEFLHAPTGAYDRDLFAIVWGPTVAALSFVFDKSIHDTVIQKSIAGFRKCAMISAHYGLSDVFDNLVISLCKFTGLLSSAESGQQIAITLGNNKKAQLALKTVLALAKRHADMLRDGWRNLLDAILQLYHTDLLPEVLTTVEDFVESNGRISLIEKRRRDRNGTTNTKTDANVFSSFFLNFGLSESQNSRNQAPEDQAAIRQAKAVLEECHIEQIITDSKFLRADSLFELVKALALAARPDLPSTHKHDDDTDVFVLELLIRVVLNNRDRVAPLWGLVRDLMYAILVDSCQATWLVQRAVVGLIRLALRLLRRDDVASHVLATLKLLLLMRSTVLHQVAQHVAFGLFELLRTNAAHIHDFGDWKTLFTLLEVVGAGASAPPVLHVQPGVDIVQSVNEAGGAQSDSEISPHSIAESADRGYTSDSELQNNTTVNQYSVCLDVELRGPIDQICLHKVCESLAFLVRDAVHITPANFESCLHAIRTLIEASVSGGKKSCEKRPQPSKRQSKRDRQRNKHVEQADDEQRTIADQAGQQVAMQLLDLLDTMHTRADSIFTSWADENGDKLDINALWNNCWCPILQGMARLCCDSRRIVRQQALTYLQRALVMPDLQSLTAHEWESGFNKVLFPLLTALLDTPSEIDPAGIDETRVRASALLSKVFLQHLTPLRALPTFTALWLTILDFMHRFMHADNSELLSDAVPESLKNMLLVMNTAGMLTEESEEGAQLWRLTWHRIDPFLPNLKGDLFKPQAPSVHTPASPRSQSPITANTQTSPSANVILQPPLPSIRSEEQITGLPVVLHPPQDVSTSTGHLEKPDD
ncbi:DgyrCDS12108 [Dimorphilus gyrociliatus]|uniref:DgyrCDS12108 n=1 Tax=Dimorphilus gyrociliatus TaxID=2664684 RepID=A0A7I8W5G4_9ANNE|nr:DgyrCDS12108 [Dimorphilus gyrociliatus]